VWHSVDLRLAPAQQHEPLQLTAVRVQKRDLEALDASVGLHLSIQLDGLVEHVERAILATAYHLAPADE
jgi:hypothetical protein